MKKKLALIMTISLLLTSISPVNAAGAEAIEDAEEEALSVSFAEDEEDPEIEIVEEPDTVSEADVSAEEVIPQEDGTDEEIFTEDISLEDVSGLIEDEDAGNGMISEIFTIGPVPVGDAEDGYGRAGSGDFMLSAASEPDGSEYYGSQLTENQKAMYEALKAGNWVLDVDDEGASVYTMAYSPDTEYYVELDNTDLESSEEFQSLYQQLYLDIFTALDAYVYDYPEETFWIGERGMSCNISGVWNPSTGMYHFILNMGFNAYERWTGAKGQLTALESYTDNSVAQIQAVDGYAAMTPGEKLKEVHDHICNLVSYGNASTVIEQQHTPYGAYYSNRKVVCEGYSKLFKILVDKLGIAENVLVSGYAHTSNSSGGAHMWNIVSLEGNWYLLDATWDDQDDPDGSSTIYYDYFLAGSGDHGTSSNMTIGAQHEAYAHLSEYGDEFMTPLLSETMYHQRKQTGVTATCTQAGSATIVCGLHPRMMMGGGHEVPAETVTIPATGHSWGDAEYVWADDNSSVTATRTCTTNPSHTASETAQTTSSVTKQATCEQAGETTYTAEFTDEAFETQTKTIANIPATGHSWMANWLWRPNNSVRVHFHCTNDPGHFQIIDNARITSVTTPATCEEPGQTVYTATITFDGTVYTDTRTVTIPKTGHYYDNPVWTWADDYTSATVTFTCTHDNSHQVTVPGTVTSEITQEPSYVTPGERTYTAVFQYNGNTFQDQKTEEIPVLSPSGVTDEGLSWAVADGVLTVSLTDDAQSTEIPDYASAGDAPWAEATAELNVSKIVVGEDITKVGSNSFAGLENLEVMNLPGSLEQLADDSVDAAVLSTVRVVYAGTESEWEALTQGTAFQNVNVISSHVHRWGEWYQKTPATCTADAILERECEICHTTETMTDENTATGHAWGSPDWQWTEDHTGATAIFTCDNDSSHIESIPAEISSVGTGPTCIAGGEVVYTAEVSFEGTTYTDEKTVQGSALGHDWGDATYTWTVDYSSVTAECACMRNESHTESETVQTTSEITKQPGCESKGETTYTAVFTKDAFETQTKTVANIAAAGHDWRGPNWQWPTNTRAHAIFTCRNNSLHTQSVFAEATPEVIKEATCETNGRVVYTAVVEFEGNTYTGQNPVTIPRMGHRWNNAEYTWADDYSSAEVTLTCDNDNTHTKTLTCTVTSEITQEPSYTTSGVKTYTAVVEYERRVYQDQKTEVIPVLTPGGVTDDGLSWAVADGVLTVSLTDGAQSTEIPDYASAGDAPWAEAAAELNVLKIVVEEGITKVGANSFAGMESLDEISLPQSLEELAEDSVDAAVLSTVNVNYAGSESEWEALTQGTAFQDVNMTSTHTHVWGEWYQKTPATCTADAILERECEICHTTETMTDENTATGHSWGSPSWEWADDYTSATLKLICDNNETHIKTLAGTVTSETTQAATYVMPGVRTHTAVAEYEGEEYRDQTTEAIPVLTPSGVTDDGLSWEIEEGVLTVCLTGGAQSTEIPDYASADDAPWAEAAAELNVSKIVVEEGITKVGAYAFKCAESLDEISLPQSLEELAEDSVDAAALSTVNVNYAGSESNWETLTQGTAFQDVNMTSTHVHSWDSGKVTKPATTAAAGVKTYKCSCGETKTESIPRLKIIEKITISKKPTIQKPAPAKGKITVKWKHFKNKTKNGKKIWKPIKKVQIQCAADSGFKNLVKDVKIGKSKTKYVIKGLTKKTTYYVRVRYYDGTGYSAWSKVKKVKTK